MHQSPGDYFGNVGRTVTSFWHGLSVTLSYLLRRPITTQYPDRTPLPVRDTLPPRYRGFLEVDAGVCTGCQACERACPIGCIQINLEKDPTNPKVRVVSQFDIDEAKCMFCGLCVEPCPTGAIQHTREFEAASTSVRSLVFRWADPAAPFPVYKVDKSAEFYPRAPLGSILRARLDARDWAAPGPKFLPPEPPKPPAAKVPPKAAAPATEGAKPAPKAPAAAAAIAPAPAKPAADTAAVAADPVAAAKVADAVAAKPAAPAPAPVAAEPVLPAPKPQA